MGKDNANGMSNFRTAAQGGGNVEIVTANTRGGSTSAPAEVAAGYIQWDTATIVVPGKSGTAANHKGGGSAQNAPGNNYNQVTTLYQIHDFDADSVGHKTGGIAGDWTNPLGVATSEGGGTGKTFATLQSSTSVAGPHIKTGTDTPFDENGFENFVAGDRIWISCTGTNTFSGYYKIVSIGTDTLALDRSIPAFPGTGTGAWSTTTACTAKKIVDTVCEVEETVKGTSENAECSNRGNCDSQTGLCTCFAGYTGEYCSVQTVLV